MAHPPTPITHSKTQQEAYIKNLLWQHYEASHALFLQQKTDPLNQEAMQPLRDTLTLAQQSTRRHNVLPTILTAIDLVANSDVENNNKMPDLDRLLQRIGQNRELTSPFPSHTTVSQLTAEQKNAVWLYFQALHNAATNQPQGSNTEQSTAQTALNLGVPQRVLSAAQAVANARSTVLDSDRLFQRIGNASISIG